MRNSTGGSRRPHLSVVLLVVLFAVGGVFLTACSAGGVEASDPVDVTLVPISEQQAEPEAMLEATNQPGEGFFETTSTTEANNVALDENAWMELPVIPEFSAQAVEILLDGIENGNDSHAFAKIGDCQNVPSMYLSMFDMPSAFSLGEEYGYLQETISWYAGSYSRESQAVRRGFNAASLVSAFWSDPDFCDAGETPLECEIRLHNPSLAIISLETWWEGAPENYEGYLRDIIETTISAGVLPILATKADNVEGDHEINRIIALLAEEYQVPL